MDAGVLVREDAAYFFTLQLLDRRFVSIDLFSMTAEVSLETEHTLSSGMVSPDGLLLQISDTSLLCLEKESMELCSDVALGSLFINTLLSICIICWSQVFFSSAFFGKDMRSNGTTATETECIILNSSIQVV